MVLSGMNIFCLLESGLLSQIKSRNSTFVKFSRYNSVAYDFELCLKQHNIAI